MLLTALTLALLASNPQPEAAPAHEHDGACHHPPVDNAAARAPAKDSNPKLVLRGEAIHATPAPVPVGTLLTDSAKLDGSTVVVEGVVRKACSSKGCWMELAASKEDKNPGVRVTFKDYGFFVPLDSAGAQAKVEGKVQVAALSEERAAHYASEGATIPRGTDGKPREVQLVATGVELRR